jgi:hypothetical protein
VREKDNGRILSSHPLFKKISLFIFEDFNPWQTNLAKTANKNVETAFLFLDGDRRCSRSFE